RLFHALAVDDAGRDALYRHVIFGNDRAFAVGRLAERVDHAADHRVAGRHLDDSLGALDDIAFFDLLKIAEQDGAHLVLFEVQRESGRALLEFQKFAGHHLFEAVNLGDPIADFDHRADLRHGHASVEVFDLPPNDFTYLVRSDFVCHVYSEG